MTRSYAPIASSWLGPPRCGLVHLFGPDANVVLARDDTRSYVWVPLHTDGVIPASNDCLRIESPLGARPRFTTPPSIPRSTNSMNSPVPSPASSSSQQQGQSPPASQSIRRRRSGQPASAVEQAIQLRDQLRLTLTATKDLIRAL